MVSFNRTIDDVADARLSMTQVKLSSKYQIVIPEDVRGELALKPGQQLQVWARGEQIVAVKVRPLSEVFGMFPGLDTSDPRDHEDRV